MRTYRVMRSNAGKYQSENHSTSCVECPPGTYAMGAASHECFSCEKGMYARKPRSTSCKYCRSPRWAVNMGSFNCTSCRNGYYYHPVTGNCVSCNVDEVRCDEEVATTLLTLDVNDGYFRFTDMSKEIYACRNKHNCKGGTVAGKPSCTVGSFGPLCGLCENGYYLEGDKARCEPCERAIQGKAVIILVAIVAFVFAGALSIFVISLKHAQALLAFYTENKTRIKDMGAKFTAFLIAMQIIVLVKENHQDLDGEPPPNPYSYFVELMGFLALDIMEFIPMACIFGRVTHLAKLLAWTIGPAIVTAILSVAIYFAKTSLRRKLVSCRPVFAGF